VDRIILVRETDCPSCYGTGTLKTFLYSRTGANGDCPFCGGTGRRRYELVADASVAAVGKKIDGLLERIAELEQLLAEANRENTQAMKMMEVA
jgi:hypothetical protein